MVRTADSALRVTGGKSTRKGGNVTARQESSRHRSPSSGSADRGGSLNSICPRDTPAWQKPITTFFTIVDKSDQQNGDAQSVSSKNGASDINMLESLNDPPQNNPHCSRMGEEFHEMGVEKIDDDKENKTGSANVMNGEQMTIDSEMAVCSINRKKKVNVRDDSDEEMGPPKRIKLDKNVYEHLEELEQS